MAEKEPMGGGSVASSFTPPRIHGEKQLEELGKTSFSQRVVIRGQTYHTPPPCRLLRKIDNPVMELQRINYAGFIPFEDDGVQSQKFVVMGEASSDGMVWLDGLANLYWYPTSAKPLKFLAFQGFTSGVDVNGDMSSEFTHIQPVILFVGRSDTGKSCIGYFLPKATGWRFVSWYDKPFTIFQTYLLTHEPKPPVIKSVNFVDPPSGGEERNSLVVVAVPEYGVQTKHSNFIRSIPSNVFQFKSDGQQRTLKVEMTDHDLNYFAYYAYLLKTGQVYYLGKMDWFGGDEFRVLLPSNEALTQRVVDFRFSQIGGFVFADEPIIDLVFWSGRVVWLTTKGIYVSDIGNPFMVGQVAGSQPKPEDGAFVPFSGGLGLRVSGNTVLVLSENGVYRLVQQGDGLFGLMQTDLPTPYKVQHPSLLPQTAEADGWYQSKMGLVSVEGQVVGQEWNNFTALNFAIQNGEGLLIRKVEVLGDDGSKTPYWRVNYFTEAGMTPIEDEEQGAVDSDSRITFVFTAGGRVYGLGIRPLAVGQEVHLYGFDPSDEELRSQNTAPLPTQRLVWMEQFPQEMFIKRMDIVYNSLVDIPEEEDYFTKRWVFCYELRIKDLLTGRVHIQRSRLRKGANRIHFLKRFRTSLCRIDLTIGWYSEQLGRFLEFVYPDTTLNPLSTTGTSWFAVQFDVVGLERLKGGID